MAEVDSLEIKIASDAKIANRAIKSIIDNLGSLSKALNIDTSKLANIGKAINVSGITSAAKNIQSQAQKISKSLSQITEQYKDLGKGFEIKGSTSQIQKQIDSLTNQLAKAKLAKEDFETSGKTNLGGYETAVKNVIKYTNQIESLKNELAEIRSVKPTVDFKINGMETAKSQISDISEKLRTVSIPQSAFNYNADAMKAVFGEAAAGIENWTQATKRFGENAGDILNKAVVETDALKAKTEQFEQSLKNLKIPTINTENISTLQRELAKAEAEVEKLRAKLANGITMGRISANVDDKGFRNLQEQIAIAEKKAEALRQKIKEVGDAGGKENVEKLGKGISGLSENGKRAGNVLNKVANSILNLSSRASGALSPINKMSNSFKGLIRTLLPILGIRQIFNWGKQSIEIASDLTEVQNVVDTTFGNMAYKVEDFAKTSIEKFGLSELSLKQYSSRFQAMGTAMGFPIDKMSDMSLELTKLTADMASFYNVEQDAIAEDLASVFTGTTRPLRQYGLDLTQATLQEWALKNGIDANIQSMSQAEKTMLRYQYVMANTGAAQGDFSRTVNTWANQVRILKQNFQQLASVIGGVLVNAFKPIVKAVNSAMGAIIEFAKTISNALGKIFGWTYEEGGGGLAGDFEAAEDAAGGIADSTGTAANNIKKMKAGLRAFDELKTISMPDSGGGGGAGASGGGGAGAGVAGDGGQWVKGESILKGFESELDTLYKLGDYIGTKLSEAMESIDWNSVYEKARNFGSGLSSFLNGLISPRLFGNVGKTIAGSLNTALHFLDSFGETFDWSNFGKSLGTGLNSFLKGIDWKTALSAAKNWGSGIGKALNSFIKTTDFKLVGSTVANALNTAIQFALSMGKEIDFKKLGDKISDSINGFFETFNFEDLAETINVWGGGLLDAIIEILEKTDWEQIGTKIGLFLSEIDYGQLLIDAIKISVSLIDAADGFIDGLSVGFDPKKILKSIKDKINEVDWGEAFDKITDVLLDIANLEELKDALDFTGIKDKMVDLIEEVQKLDFKSWFENNVSPWFTKEKWSELGGNIKSSIIGKFNSTVTEWKTKISDWWKNDVSAWFEEKKWNTIADVIKGKISLSDAVEKWKTDISYWWEKHVAPWFTKEKWKKLGDNAKSGLKGKWEEFTEWWKSTGIYNWWNNNVKPWFAKDKWNFSGIKDGLKSAWDSAISAVKNAWNNFAKWINEKLTWTIKPVVIAGKTLFEGKTINLGKIPTFKSGGFPEDGWFRASHGEIMGEFDNGQSVVANNRQITEGISLAVKSGNQESNSLMRQEISLLQRQNEILMGILQKEFGISKSDIGKAARDYSRDYFQRTGKPAYDF